MIELEKWLENTNIVKDNIHVAVYFVSLIIVVKCIVMGKHHIKTGLNIQNGIVKLSLFCGPAFVTSIECLREMATPYKGARWLHTVYRK